MTIFGSFTFKRLYVPHLGRGFFDLSSIELFLFCAFIFLSFFFLPLFVDGFSIRAELENNQQNRVSQRLYFPQVMLHRIRLSIVIRPSRITHNATMEATKRKKEEQEKNIIKCEIWWWWIRLKHLDVKKLREQGTAITFSIEMNSRASNFDESSEKYRNMKLYQANRMKFFAIFFFVFAFIWIACNINHLHIAFNETL